MIDLTSVAVRGVCTVAVALPLSGAGAPQVSGASLASLVILGVLGTGVAYVLNYQIITSEGATVAATRAA